MRPKRILSFIVNGKIFICGLALCGEKKQKHSFIDHVDGTPPFPSAINRSNNRLPMSKEQEVNFQCALCAGPDPRERTLVYVGSKV